MQMTDSEALQELVKCTKAAMLLQLDAQQPGDERAKPEVVLSRAGFNGTEIAKMLGKNAEAVRKSLQRNGKAA